MDFKGIALYLGLSFVLIFVLTFVFISEGIITFQSPNIFQYLALVALMAIPALAAFATRALHPADSPQDDPPDGPLGRRAVLRVTLMPLGLFTVAYTFAALAGFTYPQWDLAGLLNEVDTVTPEALTPEVRAIAPAVIIASYPVLSVLLGATVFALIALGSELGWRAYLVSRLSPLGAVPACLLSGLCWGLWFFPLNFGWHWEIGSYEGLLETQMRFVALAIVMSAVLGQIWLRTGQITLCALALGSVASQACGLWDYLFQQSTPPWTGPLGWVVIGVLGITACIPRLWSDVEASESAAETDDL